MRFSLSIILILIFLINNNTWSDSFDPGDNTPNGATFVVSPTGNEQIHGPHDLSSSDLEDWYQILFIAGHTYTLFTTGNTVTAGQVFDPNGNVIAGNGNLNSFNLDSFNIEPGSLHENFTPEVSGIFLVQITSLDPNAISTYTLHYIDRTTANAPIDNQDPGDDSAFAPFPLLAPQFTQQNTTPRFLSTTDIQDWYSVNLQAGIAYQFFSTGNYQLTGDLFTDNGNTRVAEGLPESNGLNFNILYQPEVNGTYFLRIQSKPEAWNSSYTLHYKISEKTFQEGDQWDTEDDIIEGATLLIPAQFEQTHGAHTLTPNDRFDWFCVVLTQGVVYRFSTQTDSNTSVDLISTDGETVLIPADNVIGETNFDLEFAPTINGTYYLRVQKADVDFAVYNLTYVSTQVLPQTEPDEWDPRDNEFAGATNLVTPSNQLQTHGEHTLTHDDRGDWFRFTLAQGQTYEFTTTGDADTFGHIFDSDGATQILSDDDDGVSLNFSITFEAPFDGIFFLLVRMADSGATGKYHLTYRQISPLNENGDPWDPADNTQSGATEISPTEIGASHGPHRIGGNDTEDWFRFVIFKDWTYEFNTAGNSDTVGAIFRNGESSAFLTNDDGGEQTNFRIQITPSQTAEYLLKVTERLGNTAEYTLQFRGKAPVTDPANPSTEIEPEAVFKLDSTAEFTHIPGGFGGAPSATVSAQPIPVDENGGSDGRGVEFTVSNGQVSLLQFPEIFAGEFSVLIRASVMTNGNAVSAALAAADGTFDGSIATNIPAQSSIFVDTYKRMVLLYDPPNDGSIIPIFQVAGTGEETAVYLDNVEIYLIPKEGDFPVALLNGQ